MAWQYTPYTFPLFLAGTMAVGLGIYVWRKQFNTPGALPFIVLQLAAAVWSVSSALDLASVAEPAKLFWIRIQYVGVVLIPGTWLVFVLCYTGRPVQQWRRYLYLLGVVPVTMHLILWNDRLQSLMYRGARMSVWEGVQVVTMDYGPWFWIHVTYSYALLLAGTALLLPVVWRSPHLYRGQFVSVLCGAVAPWLANALYIFRLSPFPHLDLTPFGFVLMGPTVAWGLFRFRLLDVVPVARHAVVERLEEGVVVCGPHGRIVDLNPAAQRLLGRPADALIGQHPAPAFAHLPVLVALLEQGEDTQAEVALGEGEGQRIVDLHLLGLRDARQRRTGQILVLHDITERKRVEEALIRAQRLSAAGELSLGLSHNLNNLLTGILGPARLLQQQGLDHAEAGQRLETILTAAGRARDLIRRLGQTVGGEEAEAVEGVDLGRAVAEAVQGARPRWQDEAGSRGAVIEVEVSLGSAPPVAVSRAGLHDVLLNLLFNAVDAMPGGGRIAVRARRVAGGVELRVSDTGVGMEEATRRRIFEPFFTTKKEGGTGLGLATAYATVTRWGGSIEVESAPGQGATFVLRLPEWRGPLPGAVGQPEGDGGSEGRAGSEAGKGAEVAAVAAAERSAGRILLVEDEAITRLVLVDVLRQAGHQVDEFASGEGALAAFRPGQYELVVVDLGIPGLPGDQLVARLQEADPGLRAGLLTGWRLQEDDPRRSRFAFYLQKPVDPRRLQQVVRQVLQTPSSQTAPRGTG